VKPPSDTLLRYFNMFHLAPSPSSLQFTFVISLKLKLNTKFLKTLKRKISHDNLSLLRDSQEKETWDEVFTNDNDTSDRYKPFRDNFHSHLNIPNQM
jgi:hypothetical protein